MQIAGTVALVTGAGGAVGERLVEQLLARDALKVYAAARAAGALKKVIALDPERVAPLALDVTDAAQAQAAARSAADVSLLFNNAGVMAFGDPLSADMDMIKRDMDTNYLGMITVTRAFAPVLSATGPGTIVNVLSLLALAPITGMSPYCASKAACHSFTQALRHELAGRNIRVIGVYPGPIDTPMLAGSDGPKADPSSVVKRILDAVEDGQQDDVTPDTFSEQHYQSYQSNPKALERELAAF